MYRVIFDEEAISFLERLDKKLKERIFNKILAAKDRPFHFFERLSGRTDYKLRIGNYRVISGIDVDNEIVHITLIGHRKNVYEK
ncbi:MAG: type II toxin-antitoxin system RelE/ParE family toxin, partial [Candidatus Woesearchaeota archaeon]